MRSVVVINFMISGERPTAERFTAEKRRTGFAFIYRADSIGGKRYTGPPLMITRTLVETSAPYKIHAAARYALRQTGRG